MIYIDRYTYIQLQYVYIYWLDNNYNIRSNRKQQQQKRDETL
jgi:hypothetical protein